LKQLSVLRERFRSAAAAQWRLRFDLRQPFRVRRTAGGIGRGGVRPVVPVV